MNPNIQYRIEWLYKNGSLCSTFANTLEIAEYKAQPFVEDKNVMMVTITKCEKIKTLKNI